MQYRAAQFNDARMSFEGVIHLDSQYDKAYYNLGATFLKLGKTSNALDSYMKAAAVNPSYDSAYFAAGNILNQAGKLEEAENYLKKAAALSPDNSRYLDVITSYSIHYTKLYDSPEPSRGSWET